MAEPEDTNLAMLFSGEEDQDGTLSNEPEEHNSSSALAPDIDIEGTAGTIDAAPEFSESDTDIEGTLYDINVDNAEADLNVLDTDIQGNVILDQEPIYQYNEDDDFDLPIGSSSEDDSQDDESEDDVTDGLAKWAGYHNISHAAITDMLHEGQNWKVRISAVICDAPACAMIKAIKGHGGYWGCGKCVQKGSWLEKVVFLEMDAALRTDEAFIAMEAMEHHTGPTPLTELVIGMVTAFPLDYMHLVCLGVVRRLLKFWMKGPLATRLGSRVKEKISDKLLLLRPHIPQEFARKPRQLKDVDRWKATEFRQFLLYTGPTVLLGNLPDELYDNFMLL